LASRDNRSGRLAQRERLRRPQYGIFYGEIKPMTEPQRQHIRDCAHRLRSRLTYIMLCSHTLRLDLGAVLSQAHDEDFARMADALEATCSDLNLLLKFFDAPAIQQGATTADDLETIVR
jgi:hypothetical protein